ncbi:MAG: cytochrome c [Proteobacteria bacterium]|nr:cytochrome c [Pseudomonadota bacterium]MDA1354807.1 cytochrome c [Pseudomonadota bacterium]
MTNIFAGALLAFALVLPAAVTAAEWPSLDLPALEAAGNLPEPIDVTVDDPVYHAEKSYSGYPLSAVLAQIPNLEKLRAEGAVAIFEAADGYKAVMSLDKALTPGGVIASRDRDAPADSSWHTFEQGKETITPAPYYLVWPNQSHDDWTFVWPYQLIRITVEPFTSAFGAAAPPANVATATRKGFDLFRTYCLRCHSVNLVGGELAPELNVPRNITEYWAPDHLRAFITNPAAYRARSKMPGFKGTLSEAELDAVLVYLGEMAKNKVCGGTTACE